MMKKRGQPLRPITMRRAASKRDGKVSQTVSGGFGCTGGFAVRADFGDEFFSASNVADEPSPIPSEPGKCATITFSTGNLSLASDHAEEVLLRNPQLEYFQRGSELVRLVTLPVEISDNHLHRAGGSMIIQELTHAALRETLDRLILWKKLKPSGPVVTDCPKTIPDFLLSRSTWQLPVLRGIITTPVLKADGTVLSAPGFDHATGLYLASDETWTIPESPTQDDAVKALLELVKPFNQFPFVSESDRAVHAAAILTGIQRSMLSSAPLFGFTSPTQRTGKSLLAESVGLIVSGHAPAATATSSEPEEFRKTLAAILREGHGLVNLDNLVRPLGSPFLAAVLTQGSYSDRVLGSTETLHLPTRVLFLANGNNLSFKGDMTVRSLLCRIDSCKERPEERVFEISNLSEYLLGHRPRLVGAALTILLAYFRAGRPNQGLRPWGGFDQWSDEIRSALVWCGGEDPARTRDEIRDDDSELETALAILSSLHRIFGNYPFILKDAVDHPDTHLQDALRQVARKGAIDSRALGYWCRKFRDRPVHGFVLRRREEEVHNTATWAVDHHD
jgi:putative DNA primase/helicase